MFILKKIKGVTVTLSAVIFAVVFSTSNAFANDVNIIMITHGTASDEFWAPVKKGAEDAADDVRVTLSYQAPEGGTDMVAMTDLIRSAINQEPDGIIVTVPDVVYVSEITLIPLIVC